ncbi:hypothetical protein K445DRAFT_118211 [Daldinia sp. EC12]|nr:hypothetical protein K445DRAFT_118211 [Daldinia sp. EC12]
MALNQDKPMHQIYINKTLLPYEQDRFGSGGVHLQYIWLGVNLAPLSIGPRTLPVPLSDTDPAFQAERVFYFKSYDKIGNHTLAVESPLAPMTWSRTYGCIKFGFGFREPPQYTYFVLVVIHAPYEERRHFISLVWDARYIHFGILSSELSLPALDEYRYHPQTSLFLRGLLDPSHHSTQEGHCWDMHGEIAKATTYMQLRPSSRKSAFSRVNFILDRENPCTDEGEAAGNRLHFLIRTELEL